MPPKCLMEKTIEFVLISRQEMTFIISYYSNNCIKLALFAVIKSIKRVAEGKVDFNVIFNRPTKTPPLATLEVRISR